MIVYFKEKIFIQNIFPNLGSSTSSKMIYMGTYGLELI